MKRILTFMIAGIMVLSLSACGNTAPSESASENKSGISGSENVQTEPFTPIDDVEQNTSQANNAAQPEQKE